MARAAVVVRQAEIQANRLGVAKMQISAGVLACALAGPGLPPQPRLAYLPFARSLSMIFRMKLL